jgi:pimeloyl-ACP methyl ester carboxylesterase
MTLGTYRVMCVWLSLAWWVSKVWSLTERPDRLQHPRLSAFERHYNMSRYQHVSSHNLGYRHADMIDLVEKSGYPVEQHFITTKDGYVLGTYRIPHGTVKHSEPHSCRKPAILQHGLLDSSATWVVNSKSQSLGFILADHGYDVWLPNSRGNAFSRNHTGFNPESKIFWDFSFDDMASYDMPAVVDYVRSHSECEDPSIALIAHSQGTTISFATLASNPDIAGKVSVFVALAPAIFLNDVSSVPLLALAKLHADTIVSILGEEEFLPSQQDMSDLFGEFCTLTPNSCISILTAICGFNPDNVDAKRLPIYLSYAPSGTSVKNMRHWAQHVRRAQKTKTYTFTKFDYGDVCSTPSGWPINCNQRVYGNPTAPQYDIESTHMPPTAIFYGIPDKLADPNDVEALCTILPNKSIIFRKALENYEHIDFTWSSNAHEDIYRDVLDILHTYS